MGLPRQLRLTSHPHLAQSRLVLGLDGWMDGGEVSTGTIDQLRATLGASLFADIAPADFYLYSFPGSMEVANLFRPATRIQEGLVVEYTPPSSRFFVSPEHELILFKGTEPHLHWEEWADCILSVAELFNVQMVYFIGSVAGLVPHTREPRLRGSVSEESLKPMLDRYGVHFTNYQGPASVITYLTLEARRRGLRMVSLVAEIPAYIQGPNPRAIESVLRRLSAILGLEMHLERLRQASDEFEAKLNKVVEEQGELAQLIAKLEEDYDAEILHTQMDELKQWLETKGIRLD